MARVSAPTRPRPHRRARTQLLVGLVPLLVLCVAVLALLAVLLAGARAPLAAATATGRATVVASGASPDGRGLQVTIDDGGRTRRGVIVLADQQQVAEGAQLAVRYDPSSPVDHTAVYADGDAAHRTVENLLFGLVVVTVVLLLACWLTGARLVSRPLLRRAAATTVPASRFVVRRGLAVRSWLLLETGRGERWLPVFWGQELTRLAAGTPIEVRGDPTRRRLVLPVVGGAELWPSGPVRARPPRGDRQPVRPDLEPVAVGWGQQVRSDVVVVVASPVLGLLWAFMDGSGAVGFALATAVAAGVLFWLPQLMGSDPAPPRRD